MDMKGASLADNTIVSAGTIVKKKHVTPNCILVGDREIRQSINWYY